MTVPRILTPDQRLRVFVSSTLRELADERVAATRAIESLHLVPVLFEIGARPHPPRNLYQAYLEQSHVFLAIYWQSYGWIAPEMEISGLEDEYRLAGDKPKLIYVKEPSPDREESLDRLLAGIRNTDQVSYKAFASAGQLQDLVQDDLAMMLTERFYQAVPWATEEPTPAQLSIDAMPQQPTPFIGRARERSEVLDLIMRDDVRLVTLSGPGGIGKTRLAFEVARLAGESFPDGVAHVDLWPVQDPERTAGAIAAALGVKHAGTETALDAIERELSDKQLLLLLDNLEHLLACASILSELLEAAPRMKIMVTSRSVLRLRAEHDYEVGPLQLPDDLCDPSPDSLMKYDSVRLFVDRAGHVRRDFRLADHASTVAEICRRLDGLPLAIELAAARIRLLTPEGLLDRLDKSLRILTSGAMDMPERQRTLRGTIDWSYSLMEEDERTLFDRIGVFVGSCSLLAIEEVCDPNTDLDLIGLLEAMVDKSLLRQESSGGEPRFSMLAALREYALERLEERGELDTTAESHARFYRSLTSVARTGLQGAQQTVWLEKLEVERPNIRAAFSWWIDNDPDVAAEMGRDLWMFWWIHGHMREGLRTMQRVLQRGEALSDIGKANAWSVQGGMEFWLAEYAEAIPHMFRGLEMFRGLGDKEGQAIQLVPIGMTAPLLEGPDAAMDYIGEARRLYDELDDEWGRILADGARNRLLLWAKDSHGREEMFEETVERARRHGTDLLTMFSLSNIGWLYLQEGNTKAAEEAFQESLEGTVRLGAKGDAAYCLEGLSEVAEAEGRPRDAVLLLAAAEAIRTQTSYPRLGGEAERTVSMRARLEAALGPERLAEGWRAGTEMSFDEMVQFAREQAGEKEEVRGS